MENINNKIALWGDDWEVLKEYDTSDELLKNQVTQKGMVVLQIENPKTGQNGYHIKTSKANLEYQIKHGIKHNY